MKSKTSQRNNIVFMQYNALMLACIAFNLIGNTFCNLFNIPMQVSTIGTLTCSVIGGGLQGIIVAIITSIIKSIYDFNAIYYCIIDVIVALCGTFLAKNLLKTKSVKFFLAGPIITWCVAIPKTVIMFFLSENISESIENSLFHYINKLGFSKFTCLFLGNVYFELLNSFIVLPISFLLIFFISSKIDFDNFGIWQGMLTSKDKETITKIKCRYMSIRAKIFLIIVVSGLIISCISIGISFVMYKNSTIEANVKLAESVNDYCISIINPEKINNYLENGSLEPGYIESKNKIIHYLNNNADIKYIYVYKVLPDGCHVIFDLENGNNHGDNPGEIISFNEDINDQLNSFLNGNEIEPIINKSQYGWLLTVYKPLYDSDKICQGYVGVDISMDIISNYCNVFLVKFISLMGTMFCLIAAISLWIIKHNIIYPINSLASFTQRFAFDDTENRDNGIDYMKKMDIHTGDEVENLYKSILKTVSDIIFYTNDIKKKNETILKMQSGLIMVLADMVESRDQCTGNHIRKTVAYVAIISDEMKKLGFYKDEITDSFMENLMYSAPLHDIGKIHVPDNILSKPGKLSDEEFEIMKMHTTYGSDMLEKVIEIAPDSNYLKEAKKVAKFHHEKWDGTGYPCGIKDLEIPLSARIMAVADVFDALTSKRSYKKPFTFKKAVNIIQEGKNKHFDPLVVDAFINALERIKIVCDEYAEELNE